MLGTSLGSLLHTAGHNVLLIDNTSGCDKNRIPKELKLFIGNATVHHNLKVCFDSFKPDVIFVCLAFNLKKGVNYNFYEDVNTTLGSANMLSGFITKAVKHVVFCSSSEVYGGPEPKQPVKEDRKIIQPSSHFGNANLLSEQVLSYRCAEVGVPFSSLRIFDLVGPRYEISPKTAVINFMIEAFLTGEEIGITRGDRKRDFIHVEDVADICFKVVTSDPVGGIFNVGSGVGISLEKIYYSLSQHMKITYPPVFLGDSSINTFSAVADIAKVSDAYGWAPKNDVLDYLPKLVEYTQDLLSKSKNAATRLALARGFK